MSRNLAQIGTAFLAGAVLLTGCAISKTVEGDENPTVVEETPKEQAAPAAPEDTPESAPEEAAPEPEAEPEATVAEPAVQEETCGWDSPAVSGDSGGAPNGQEGDLATVIVGAWQHTHFDSGSGFEPNGPGTDIRYVFPSATRILYCQDVAGATNQAQNAADITLDGTKIVLPGSAPGYTATAWNADTMVWTNNLDGSTYLLKRR